MSDLYRADDVQRAANLIRHARYAIALTGAGISVPSGIPDFRSPQSGLWERYDPMEVASLASFRRHPERFYDWIRPLLETTRNARPNPAHEALARLQAAGYLHEIITQNIDGLHEAAGSRDVLPVHGHTRTGTCLHCGRQVEGDVLWQAVEAGEVPRCAECGGVLKPDVILFGELLPMDVFERARQAAERADLVLVAGSSLEVAPAADLPLLTLNKGGSLLIVNLGPTALDWYATLKIEGDVAEVLPRLADLVLNNDA